MPIDYVIDSERHLVITTGSGIVTFAEVRAHQDHLRNDPAFDPTFNQLIDLTAVTDLQMLMAEAETLVRGSTFFSPTSRRAWVATSPALYGMGRWFEAHYGIVGGRGPTGVFRDRNSALQWLTSNSASAG